MEEDGKNAASVDPAAEAMNVQAYLRVHAPLLLRTYTQQVGGHALFMELGENVLCKPVNSREKLIYEFIPQEIKDFMPKYHGEPPRWNPSRKRSIIKRKTSHARILCASPFPRTYYSAQEWLTSVFDGRGMARLRFWPILGRMRRT